MDKYSAQSTRTDIEWSCSQCDVVSVEEDGLMEQLLFIEKVSLSCDANTLLVMRTY